MHSKGYYYYFYLNFDKNIHFLLSDSTKKSEVGGFQIFLTQGVLIFGNYIARGIWNVWVKFEL